MSTNLQPSPELPSNIILLGMSQAGKSTVGHELAELTGKEFIDMDKVLCRRFGSIQEVIGQHGLGWFKARENELSWELGANNNQVIAAGRGIVVNHLKNSQNAEIIKSNIKALTRPRVGDGFAPSKTKGSLILLLASAQTIKERIKSGHQIDLDELENKIQRRRVAYYLASSMEVINEGLSPRQTAQQIIHGLLNPLQDDDLWFMPKS